MTSLDGTLRVEVGKGQLETGAPNLGSDVLAQVVDAINAAFRTAAAGPLKGILAVSEEPLVSIDFRGTTASSIVDAPATMVIGGKTGKVLSWYDNEYAYAARCVDVAKLYAK